MRPTLAFQRVEAESRVERLQDCMMTHVEKIQEKPQASNADGLQLEGQQPIQPAESPDSGARARRAKGNALIRRDRSPTRL